MKSLKFERYSGYKPNILVIGDIIMDHYIHGECDRISSEAAVPIVQVTKENRTLGGAGNVIKNLVSLEANVYACSVVADDTIGQEMVSELNRLNVNTEGILFSEGRSSVLKTRVLVSQHQLVRFDKESTIPISKALEAQMVFYVTQNLSKFQIILLSDYDKGVLTKSLCQTIISLARDKNIKVLVDPKNKNYSKFCGAFLLTPNKKEAGEASGIEIKNDSDLEKVGFTLKKKYNLNYMIITLSEMGMAIFDQEMIKIPVKVKQVSDVTGAGDTVLASLGYSLSLDENIIDACKFANAAAAIVVGKVGTSTATIHEISAYLSRHHKGNTLKKVCSWEELQNMLNVYRLDNKKIVFTNGCFDILHAGHIKCLLESKRFGDVLILGLNNDDSIKRLKGLNRPINCLEDRIAVLSALEIVDLIVAFGEDTPYNLIKIIRPDVIVKGEDYKDAEVSGSDLAGEIRFVKFAQNQSTSRIVQRMHDLDII